MCAFAQKFSIFLLGIEIYASLAYGDHLQEVPQIRIDAREGVYDVQWDCIPSWSADLCLFIKKIERMTLLLNEQGQAKLNFFINSGSGKGSSYSSAFEFSNITLDSHKVIKITPQNNTSLTPFFETLEIQFNPKELSVQGWIQDSNPTKTLALNGKQKVTPLPPQLIKHLQQDFQGPVPDISGNYSLIFKRKEMSNSQAEGQLKLIRTSSNHYQAFFNSSYPSATLLFNQGELVFTGKHRKVLRLFSSLDQQDFIQWTFLSSLNNEDYWRGVGISTKNGNFYHFEMRHPLTDLH